MDKINELLTRGVANIIPSKEKLEELLKSGKKLNIYLGIDPTAIQIHLGHAVPLRKLEAFANLGHNVTFLIGDFTALIGDTSDKESERPVLTVEQIEENFQTYKTQAGKILDFEKVTVKFNSEWLKDLSFAKIIKLCQHFSVGDFVGRELIRKRLDQGKRVGLHEVLYPVMQGYDSYHLDTDIQVGGTDQTFNMQAGRTLIKDLKNKDSFIITNVFLEGTDGRKMSKTWGNAIWINDSPSDMYAKIMSIRDDLTIQYYTLATNISLDEIAKIKSKLETGESPMAIKKDLAHRIVSELYDKNSADQAAEHFEKTVQQKEAPQDLQTIEIKATDNITIADILVKAEFSSSRSEAKRLIEQGGVSVDNEIVKDPDSIFKGELIKVGKRRFVKIKTAD